MRPGCGAVAAATLTYDYASRTVWLDEPGSGEPGAWGMCAPHADNLRVPIGWAIDDRRHTILQFRPPVAV